MFADMNRGFANRDFEFQTDTAYLVRTFLVLFDAIFTLNQDLLLERHYLNDNVMLGNHPRGRWNGWQIVGMQRRHATNAAGFIVPGEANLGIWVPAPKAVIEPRYQPYIKLQGSSNWRDATDARIWVMGTNKRATLSHFSFLTELHEFFRQSLTAGPTRLMVIGYSFNDEHINQMILSAADRGQLELFVIDPLGIGVLDKNASHPIYSEHELLQRLKVRVIGASRRTLGEIFGADQVEHRKVMGFFPVSWLPRDRPWPGISEG
jgi:SIR2-like domain